MVSSQPPICKALILKVASRCNLNCSYCYMYNLGDHTYKNQPKFMSSETVALIISQVKAHCERHQIRQFEFIFHGGEPLLLKPDFYKKFVNLAQSSLLPQTKPFFNLQTNGILLNENWCQTLGKLEIGIGISLDGAKEDNDLYRKNHDGSGSYDQVLKGLRIAQSSRSLPFPLGILTVINVASDPEKTYQHLKSLNVKYADFLLPDCTFQKLPPFKNAENAPYADWLIKVFDLWYYDKQPKPTIRLFTQLIRLMIGYDEAFEYFGNQKNEFLVIETNGFIEVTGAFKVCGNGFTKKNYHISSTSIDEVLKDDFYKMYHAGHQQICDECKECPIVEVCGGGFVAHRFSEANAFDNPSVYCLDLKMLITHIQNIVYDFLPQNLKTKLRLKPLRIEDLKKNKVFLNEKEMN